MNENKPSKWIIFSWLFVPYIMAPLFIIKHLNELKSGDNKLRTKAALGLVWAIVSLIAFTFNPPPKTSSSTVTSQDQSKPSNQSTSTNSHSMTDIENPSEQMPQALHQASKPSTVTSQDQSKPSNQSTSTNSHSMTDIEDPSEQMPQALHQASKPKNIPNPVCGEYAINASKTWQSSKLIFNHPCTKLLGDDEFAKHRYEECIKKESRQIRRLKKEWNQSRHFKSIDSEHLKWTYNVKDKSFVANIPSIIESSDVKDGNSGQIALKKPHAVDEYYDPRDGRIGNYTWKAPDYSFKIPYPMVDAEAFKERHKPKRKGGFFLGRTEYPYEVCISYKIGKAKKHKKLARDSDWVPGQPKLIDMGAGEITIAKNVHVLLWSKVDKRVIFDSAESKK